MKWKFIAGNGDDVGNNIGSAIASDNHEELSRLTSGLKDAHNSIEQWISSVGGEIVTSSGDEFIYKIPSDAYDEGTIESMRDQYSQTAGTTITVGVGDSMSEASKALIYGKLNDKDQIVEYDSSIDDYIASHEDEADMETPQDDLEDDSGEMVTEDLDGDGDIDKLSMQDDTEDEMGDEDSEGANITVPADEMVDEHEDLVDTLESPEHDDDLEEADEQAQELEQYKDVEDSGEDSFISEDEEDQEDEIPMEGDETLSEEGELSEDDLDVAPEDKLDEIVGEDLDGDGDIDKLSMQDDTEDEMGGEMGDEMPMDEANAGDQGAIADMIHANMGDESPDGEMDAQNEGSDDELRQDIIASLQTFKENKPMLEQAKTQNPKLYEATILMLRSMIEMAKKQGMNPMGHAEGQEVQDAMPDADMIPPEEGDEEMDGEQMPPQVDADVEEIEDDVEDDADEDQDEQKKKAPFQKNEMTKLYYDLMKGMKTLQKADNKKYWRQELQERDKKRRDAKIKAKKKINGKKPIDAAIAEVKRKMQPKKEEVKKIEKSEKDQNKMPQKIQHDWIVYDFNKKNIFCLALTSDNGKDWYLIEWVNFFNLSTKQFQKVVSMGYWTMMNAAVQTDYKFFIGEHNFSKEDMSKCKAIKKSVGYSVNFFKKMSFVHKEKPIDYDAWMDDLEKLKIKENYSEESLKKNEELEKLKKIKDSIKKK